LEIPGGGYIGGWVWANFVRLLDKPAAFRRPRGNGNGRGVLVRSIEEAGPSSRCSECKGFNFGDFWRGCWKDGADAVHALLKACSHAYRKKRRQKKGQIMPPAILWQRHGIAGVGGNW